MATLANFPMVSQLSGITSNGLPSLNAEFDCVPSSIGAAILWYQGKSQWNSQINPNSIKDAAYSQGYTGGTSAEAYIPFCKSLGFNLSSINGNPSQLVTEAHSQIKAGHPVIFTRDDPYSTNPNYTHVCVFYDEGNGWLAALDPYIASRVQLTDSQWEAKLRFNQIWVLTQINGGNTLLQLSDPMGQHFSEVDATRWHCKDTNVDVAYAHLSFYRQNGGVFRLPLTGEINLAQYPGTALQIYEAAIAAYDPANVFKQRPEGSGPVYLLKLNIAPAQQIIAKPLLAALTEQVTSLQNELSTAKAQAANYETQISELQNELAGKPDTAPLEAKITAYQQALATIENALLSLKGN